MCGIVGALGWVPQTHQRQQALRLLAPRGPDAQGEQLLTSARGDVRGWFGHRRLAVVDLSDAGAQPMQRGGVVLTYNGEVYDAALLRKQLSSNYEFLGTSDTEVLVRGYQLWGMDGLLERARGMFAFGLWDSEQEALWLARDRLGQKPLFYAQHGGQLSFASTLPALLALRDGGARLAPAALCDYFVAGYVGGTRAMGSGAYKLLPGHVGRAAPGHPMTTQPYYSLPSAQPRSDYSSADLERTLDAAVERRLVADVPVSAFLSGGIDSSLVVSSMARFGKVVTLCAAFQGEPTDEAKHAREVAQYFGTEHHELSIAFPSVEDVVVFAESLAEPLADHAAFPTWLIARAARARTTVVLTGDGGDELFAGYPTYLAARIAQNLSYAPQCLLDKTRVQLGRRGPARLRGLLEMTRPGGAYLLDPNGRKGFRNQLEPLLGKRSVPTDMERQVLWSTSREESWQRKAQRVDTLTLLADGFLPKIDMATMAHSLEARSPFLDTDVVNASLALPDRALIRRGQGKHILRELLGRRVPGRLARRPKMGFSPPTSRWLRGELGSFLEGLLGRVQSPSTGAYNRDLVRHFCKEHRAGRADHGQRLWAVLVLELWCRAHLKTGQSVDQPKESGGKVGGAWAV